MVGLRLQLVVLAPEGHNPRRGRSTAHPRHAVRMQAGAVHDAFRLEGAPRGFQLNSARTLVHAQDSCAAHDASPGLADDLRQPVTDAAVVHNAHLRHVNRLDPSCVRLQFAEPARIDDLADHTIAFSAIVQGVQAGKFCLIDGHNHFAARLVSDALRSAERFHGLLAGTAVSSFQGAGRVVDAGMQDSRVVARLVLGDCVFLLQHDDAPLGVPCCELVGRGQPHDARPHDRHVRHLHLQSFPLVRGRARRPSRQT